MTKKTRIRIKKIDTTRWIGGKRPSLTLTKEQQKCVQRKMERKATASKSSGIHLEQNSRANAKISLESPAAAATTVSTPKARKNSGPGLRELQKKVWQREVKTPVAREAHDGS
jgi:hypothetical protein